LISENIDKILEDKIDNEIIFEKLNTNCNEKTKFLKKFKRRESSFSKKTIKSENFFSKNLEKIFDKLSYFGNSFLTKSFYFSDVKNFDDNHSKIIEFTYDLELFKSYSIKEKAQRMMNSDNSFFSEESSFNSNFLNYSD